MNATFIISQVLLFCAVIVVFYSVRNIMIVRGDTVRRLRQKLETTRSMARSTLSQYAEDNTFLSRVGKLLKPHETEQINILRLKLSRAGFREASAVMTFYAWRVLLSLGALAFSLFVLPFAMRDAPIALTLLTLLLIVMAGYFAPAFWVERTFQNRRILIEKGFPDALDLLLVCIEAGNGFDQALGRVVREFGEDNKVLADDLAIVIRELRAGKDRYKALTDFAERTGVEDIISFITVIKQADKYGVSIAEALRVYSREMRDKRYMKAEEIANLMPVKLALGAIAFTVPPAILVMVGPSMIMIVRNLLGGAAG